MITAANMNQAYGGQVPLKNTGVWQGGGIGTGEAAAGYGDWKAQQPMTQIPGAGTEDQRMYAGGTQGFNGNFGVVSPTANTMNAAWDGQFWDDEKLKAAVAAQGAGNNIANDASWMQALNPLSGISIKDPARAGYTDYRENGDIEVAGTDATYTDALGRAYRTIKGDAGDNNTYIQFNDSEAGGWQNPTGSKRDRVNPIYKLNADGTATPHSANTNYAAGEWNRSGQEIATWAAIMASAGIGGAALQGASAVPTTTGGASVGGAVAGSGSTIGEGVGAAAAGSGGGSGAAGAVGTDLMGATVSSGASAGSAGAAWAPTAATASGTAAGSTLPAWATKAGTGALTSAAGTALQGGNSSQIMNSAVGGAVNGGTGTNLGGAVTGALNGSGSGSGGSGGGSGGSTWDQFLQGLSGGSGGSTDWGSILNSLGTGYAAYEAGKKADNAYTNQINSINGLYAPDSAYAKQMEQTLARKDAAAGRNSQYGTRAVELAANLTDSKSKAINSANYTNLMAGKINAQNQFPASLVSLMQGKGGQQALSGLGGAIGSGVSSGYNWLADLYRGYTGDGTTGQTADPSIGPQMPSGGYNIDPAASAGDYQNQYDNPLPSDNGYYDDYGNWIQG